MRIPNRPRPRRAAPIGWPERPADVDFGALTDDLIPIRMPHFEVQGSRLLFLLAPSRAHATLDPDDVTLWARIDSATPIGRLRDSCGDVESRLRRFWSLGACEFAPSRLGRSRKPVLVLEPHMDDAVLSVGGMMWSRREECEFTIASVTGRSNVTNRCFVDHQLTDVEEVSALRKAESALATRMLGGRHITLDELDAPLRGHQGDRPIDWDRRFLELANARVGHASSDQEIDSWALAIGGLLAATDAMEVWVPLGVGGHTDHELTRDACLRAFARLPGFEHRTALFFYQDVPYASRFPYHTDDIVTALIAAGGSVEEQCEDITAVFGNKLRLMSVYASQVMPSDMAAEVRLAARLARPSKAGCCELRYRVTALPKDVEPLALYSRREAVHGLATRLGPWYHRHRSAPRIRVVSQAPSGRWAADFSFLLHAFPQAVLEVAICEAGGLEAESLTSPRIDVQIVSGRADAWIRLLLRFAVGPPCPLIVVTGDRRPVAAWVARSVCARSDPISATSINDLVQALRLARGATPGD
jgi:LmbE family N-acetylglucosaminyl deacetylase